MIMRSLYIILFVLCANLLSAQINTGALPASFKHNLSFEQVDHISLYPPNMELIRSEDAEAEKNGTMMKVARLIPFTANIDNSGTWERTSDGKNIWRLRVSSDGAKSCVLHFDEFELPQGSELFVYNPDRTVVLGPYTSTDNDDGGSYAIGVVYGQELIIEYIAPLAKSLTGQVKPIKPIIEMSAFSYFYRGAELYDNRASANFGSSGSCMVNANCSEGNNWRAQQKGVARIYVVEGGYGGWCSGTLVNNTNNDQTPYFLTADHCGGSATSYELGQWIFRFKYESAGCTATSEPSGSNITGCTKKARGPLSGGSDFLLLQLNTTSTNLKNIGVVYNGWTASPSASPSGVSFHHPSGDIKKVSTYTSQLTTVSYGDGAATGAHWMVNWASTAHGHSVTEGGSSGSPIFNNNGLVVGTLTGGSSYCTSPTSPDAYGKFSYHWTSNGTTNDKQLKPWLAPNSSATSCDYLDPNNVGLVCNFSGTPTTVIVGNSVSFTDLSTGGTITSRSWSFPGGSPSSSSSPSPTIIYNTPGTYNVTLTVTAGSQNATETKNGYITVVEQGSGFTYDFEACTNFAVDQFSPCTTYDGDGSYTYSIQTVEFENQNYAGSFIAFNASATNPSLAGGNWDAHGGSKCGACFSATTPPNNDWFITPKINLESNSSFSFWAKTANTNYGKERFNVLISTTNNNISSFTKISTGTYTEAPTTWTKYNYDLNAYNGQGVYLAIQCVSNDAHAFLIDDIEVLTTAGGTVTAPVANFTANTTSGCAPLTVSFSDQSSNNATSWSWIFNGATPSSSISPNPTVIYNTPGIYSVTLTASNAGGSNTKTMTNYITVNDCAPVNDNFASKFSIYPNPTDGIVYIDIPESKATVRISDILGKVVKVANLSSNQSSIDLSTLKSGMYFIEIQLSEAKYTSKLTIQ
jgi:PKD repeat protein